MYIILEIQVNNGVGAILPAVTKNTRQEAESVYHGILAYAATSSIEKHSAIILDEDCVPIMYKCYEHPKEVTNGED